MTQQPGWDEVEVRASSIKDALDCAMRFEAKHLRRIRMPSSGAAHLGTALHAGTAAYDRAVLEERLADAGEAADVLVNKLSSDVTDDGDDVVWDSTFTRKDALSVGLMGLTNYIEKIGSKRRYKAVEAQLEKFRIQFPDQKIVIALTGTTDRVRQVRKDTFEGGIGYGISDIKSGANRVSAKDNTVIRNAEKAQLAVYELIAERATGIEISAPAEIVGISTAKHASVGTTEVHGTREAIVGTSERPGILDFIARMLRSGLFPPNPASKLCHERFCPIYRTCPYHD